MTKSCAEHSFRTYTFTITFCKNNHAQYAKELKRLSVFPPELSSEKKKKRKSTLYGWNNLFNVGTKIAKCSNYIIILSVSVNPL